MVNIAPIPDHHAVFAQHPSVEDDAGDRSIVKYAVDELVGGVLAGYSIYWISRACQKIQLMDPAKVLDVRAFVVVFVTTSVIKIAARIAYEVALYALGDRAQYENQAAPPLESFADRLRTKAWTVIAKFERIPKKVDRVYSQVYGIRTDEEIRHAFIDEKQYYLADPADMEILRRAFSEEIESTFKTSLSSQLGIYGADVIGYPFPFASASVGFRILGFIAVLYAKIKDIKACIAKTRSEEESNRRVEFKVNMAILKSFYPSEFAKLDKLERLKTDEKDQMKEFKRRVEFRANMAALESFYPNEFVKLDQLERLETGKDQKQKIQ